VDVLVLRFVGLQAHEVARDFEGVGGAALVEQADGQQPHGRGVAGLVGEQGPQFFLGHVETRLLNEQGGLPEGGGQLH
jgi:hypothetical protein